MYIKDGKKYYLTMPKRGTFFGITRKQALSRTNGSGIVTIYQVTEHTQYGTVATIQENGLLVSTDYLTPLYKIIKYNKDKQCPNLL